MIPIESRFLQVLEFGGRTMCVSPVSESDGKQISDPVVSELFQSCVVTGTGKVLKAPQVLGATPGNRSEEART